jgi:hypothetical protein
MKRTTDRAEVERFLADALGHPAPPARPRRR